MKKIKELYNKISPYVVQLVATEKQDGKEYVVGSGTGFVTGDGFLITNHHVIQEVLNNSYYNLGIRLNHKNDRACIFDRDDIQSMITDRFSQENYNDYVILDLSKSIHLSVEKRDVCDRCENCPFVIKRPVLEFQGKDGVEIGQ